MNSKVALIAGFLFLTTFVCCTFVAADNEFNVVPKLYEEIGCTETKNSGKKRYGNYSHILPSYRKNFNYFYLKLLLECFFF